MKQYSSFKKVDSFWFTEVPDHWKETKNRYIFKENKNSVGEKWEDFTLLTMGKDGVRIRDLEGGGKFPESFDKYKIVEPDNLIFCLYDLDETPRTVGISKYQGMITSSYDILSVNSDNNPHYWNYFYQNIDNSKSLKPYYTGLRKVVRIDNFKDIKIYTPPLEEQNQIVSYLDQKTQQISNQIREIKTKIKLLNDSRNSLIEKVVSKGINLNVEMKNSDVEWIGDIPSHWTTKKLKYLVQHVSEKKTPEEEDIKISPEYVESNTGVCRNLYSEHTGDGYKFQKGDILLNKLRIYLKKVLLVEYEGLSVGEMIVLRTDNTILSKFIFNTLFSDRLIGYLNSLSTGVKVPRVSPENILSTKFPLPPLNEMDEINKFVDQKNQSFFETISIEEERIELLEKYKKSLISEVVTGKKRVVN